MTYTQGFYDQIEAGTRSSAEVIVPVLIDLFAPESVVDVGCGQGWWLDAFAARGCDIQGFDGHHVDRNRLAILDEFFTPCDLATERVNAQADMAISLEVAEHIPASRAPFLIADLCSIAEVVVFSAATPGQGGVGHVNEQWPKYWVDRFERQGFKVSGGLRWLFWNNPGVENWYSQNLMVAAKRPQDVPELFEGAHNEPFPVIHPVQWAAFRGVTYDR
jgi:hypothetical protein